MTVGKHQEVRVAVTAELERLTKPPYALYSGPMYLQSTHDFALAWLYSQGYISDPSASAGATYSLTPEGWGYWERLRLWPTRYWTKYNWFPMAVATTTVVVCICTILAQLLD